VGKKRASPLGRLEKGGGTEREKGGGGFPSAKIPKTYFLKAGNLKDIKSHRGGGGDRYHWRGRIEKKGGGNKTTNKGEKVLSPKRSGITTNGGGHQKERNWIITRCLTAIGGFFVQQKGGRPKKNRGGERGTKGENLPVSSRTKGT